MHATAYWRKQKADEAWRHHQSYHRSTSLWWAPSHKCLSKDSWKNQRTITVGSTIDKIFYESYQLYYVNWKKSARSKMTEHCVRAA